MKKRFLAFGILLGIALGVLGSSIEILVWIWKGRPAVLIRRGWEDTHIAVMVVCGLLAGCLYGTILSQVIGPNGLRARGAFVFLLTLVAGIVFYGSGAFISIALDRVWPSLWANVAIFLTSLVVARVLSRNPRAG